MIKESFVILLSYEHATGSDWRGRYRVLSITQKALLIGVLVAAFALVAAAPAMANWLDWSEVATLPGNGTSPHGGYSTTTVKCAVCHSVHKAGNVLDSELLLPSSVGDVCAYCHVNSASGYTQVYYGVLANYSGTDFDNAHNSFQVNGVEQGVVCTNCHHVHAAANQMTQNAALTQRLLKNWSLYDPTAGAPTSSDSKELALTKWCAGCHFNLPPGDQYYANEYDMGTHIMGPARDNYGNPNASYSGRIAWKDSTYCTSCHASDYGVEGGWPHMTQGMRFLVAAAHSTDSTIPASDARQDGICLRCHRHGSGSGVGQTY